MAKGQMKGNKEAKKPKADKNQPKATVSAYKLSQSIPSVRHADWAIRQDS